MARIEIDPQWLLNIFCADEADLNLYVDVNTQNTRIWTTSNHREYRTKTLHPVKFTVWCGGTSSFIVRRIFVENHVPFWAEKRAQ